MAKKRVLSIVLALMLVLSTMPMSVFAKDIQEGQTGNSQSEEVKSPEELFEETMEALKGTKPVDDNQEDLDKKFQDAAKQAAEEVEKFKEAADDAAKQAANAKAVADLAKGFVEDKENKDVPEDAKDLMADVSSVKTAEDALGNLQDCAEAAAEAAEQANSQSAESLQSTMESVYGTGGDADPDHQPGALDKTEVQEKVEDYNKAAKSMKEAFGAFDNAKNEFDAAAKAANQEATQAAAEAAAAADRAAATDQAAAQEAANDAAAAAGRAAAALDEAQARYNAALEALQSAKTAQENCLKKSTEAEESVKEANQKLADAEAGLWEALGALSAAQAVTTQAAQAAADAQAALDKYNAAVNAVEGAIDGADDETVNSLYNFFQDWIGSSGNDNQATSREKLKDFLRGQNSDDAPSWYEEAVREAKDRADLADKTLKEKRDLVNQAIRDVREAKENFQAADGEDRDLQADLDAALENLRAAQAAAAQAAVDAAEAQAIVDAMTGGGDLGDVTIDDEDVPLADIADEAVPLAAGPVTRAQFVDYLWRHEGAPEAEAEPFADVPAGHEYAAAIAWARSIAIIEGDGNNNFMPDELVTVSAAQSILTKYAAYLGMETPALTALTGADADPVFNCDQVLAEFFGEEYTAETAA